MYKYIFFSSHNLAKPKFWDIGAKNQNISLKIQIFGAKKIKMLRWIQITHTNFR